MKTKTSKQNKGNHYKVWTAYDILGAYHYIVYVKIGNNKTYKTFGTKFFAKIKAKKVAKILGVEPDLRFKPIIDR